MQHFESVKALLSPKVTVEGWVLRFQVVMSKVRMVQFCVTTSGHVLLK